MVVLAENAPTMTFAECGSLLLRLKRAIRHALASRDSWVARSRIARRALARLNGAGGTHLIFVRRAIGAEYAEAAQRIREANAVLREGGQHLFRIGDVIDRATSLQERCDLLGVSTVDRCKLPSSAGLVEIAGVHRLEASASTRGDDYKSGPFFEAIHLVLMDFLCNTPEGRACGDALFEPRGLLESVPRYSRAPDGSMVRCRPLPRIIH